MQQECVHCPRPVADAGYLCHDCADDLTKALALTAGLGGHLEVTITRQDRIGSGAGRTAETPLPYNDSAAESADAIRNTMTTWARHIIETRGLPDPADLLAQHLATLTAHAIRSSRPPLALALLGRAIAFARRARAIQLDQAGRPVPLAEIARFLAGQVRWIRHQPIAEAAYDELMHAARAAARTCDARPSLTSLGPCITTGCDGILRAPHGRRTTRCPECGEVYDVAERMDQLLTIGGDYMFTVRELSSILSQWARRLIPEGTIGSWGSRGQMPHKGELAGAALYRLADAKALAERMLQAEEERVKKRAEKRKMAA